MIYVYTLSPLALGIYIRQIPRGHGITITYSIAQNISLCCKIERDFYDIHLSLKIHAVFEIRMMTTLIIISHR